MVFNCVNLFEIFEVREFFIILEWFEWFLEELRLFLLVVFVLLLV